MAEAQFALLTTLDSDEYRRGKQFEEICHDLSEHYGRRSGTSQRFTDLIGKEYDGCLGLR